ncbi:MAG TPA: hypothetical protein VFU19_20735 [Iamia sp.]|nr:hypothetical protein [Iamia sp.]
MSETGVVEEWDDPRGVGRIRADDGRLLDLQCTHLADGSRTTAVGTRVTFATAPGHHGRWQALNVIPTP